MTLLKCKHCGLTFQDIRESWLVLHLKSKHSIECTRPQDHYTEVKRQANVYG